MLPFPRVLYTYTAIPSKAIHRSYFFCSYPSVSKISKGTKVKHYKVTLDSQTCLCRVYRIRYTKQEWSISLVLNWAAGRSRHIRVPHLNCCSIIHRLTYQCLPVLTSAVYSSLLLFVQTSKISRKRQFHKYRWARAYIFCIM